MGNHLKYRVTKWHIIEGQKLWGNSLIIYHIYILCEMMCEQFNLLSKKKWMHKYLLTSSQIRTWSIINLLLQTLEIINYVQWITYIAGITNIQRREYYIPTWSLSFSNIFKFVYTHANSKHFHQSRVQMRPFFGHSVSINGRDKHVIFYTWFWLPSFL